MYWKPRTCGFGSKKVYSTIQHYTAIHYSSVRQLKSYLLPIPPKSNLPSQGFRALLGYIEVPHKAV